MVIKSLYSNSFFLRFNELKLKEVETVDIHTLIQIQNLISDMNNVSEVKKLISSLIQKEDEEISKYMEE